MKNTLKQGKIRFMIVGRGNKYIGICYEFGFVEEGDSLDYVQKRLLNGVIALLGAHKKDKNLNIKSLNTRPSLKYALLFYAYPFIIGIASVLLRFKNIFTLNTYSKSITELQRA